jgi:hypothetical protein
MAKREKNMVFYEPSKLEEELTKIGKLRKLGSFTISMLEQAREFVSKYREKLMSHAYYIWLKVSGQEIDIEIKEPLGGYCCGGFKPDRSSNLIDILKLTPSYG